MTDEAQPIPSLPRRRRSGGARPFTRQMFWLILAAMALVGVVMTALFAWTGFQRLVQQTQASALHIAQTVAADPSVREAAERESDRAVPLSDAQLVDSDVAEYASDVEDRTGALFVVVTDDSGRRLAHPDEDRIGDPVSTSPESALAGEETVSWERGTLGDSARAKVPIRSLDDPDRVVGEVSVGFAPSRVWATVAADAAPVGLAAVFALLVGALAAWIIARRLRRDTLGLEPDELLGLALDQEAVLGGVGDGVLGTDVGGRVTVANPRALELLGISDAVGRPLAAVVGGDIAALLADDGVSGPLVHGDRVLFLESRPVNRDGRRIGRVAIVRDRTDVEALSRRLTAVETLGNALRAQRHEFANRLHVLSGLLRNNDVEEASDYLAGVVGIGPVRFPLENADLIREPFLQAFLGAKGVEAEERGVRLRIGNDTDAHGSLRQPDDVTTILGNLVDNGIDAAVESPAADGGDAWVEVEALVDGEDLYLSVMDSGVGVSGDPFAQRRERDGRSDPVHGHGIGLPLSRDIARRSGGDLWLASTGAAGRHGAVFCVRLPGAVHSDGDGVSSRAPGSNGTEEDE
ncbi:two-component system CitB family sensor kinase [Labedella gwakjiensis]|uniref:histidine kinase n=2 Tax=Labedella gwakjiensis TaxID=390269 RepID=A0A2P8GYF2_9MICO|nr:sensor histidine kinase [Labedella gwakjiensis]PSL38997.1 two-component system CitB family sensor kinase [Labedella gwakjiensis]